MEPSKLSDFTAQAEAYRRARPGYPDALLNQLISYTALKPGEPVADLGAGTGLFTQMLAARGLIVSAVEPNDAMRENAPQLSNTTWIKGTFETSGLPSGSQQWVVAAQSFHWADPVRALTEMHRILRPKCYFTILWNNRQNERNAVLQWTCAAIKRHIGDFDEAYRDDRNWENVLVSTGDFDMVAVHQAEHVVAMSRERYLDLWRSHNRLNVEAGPERFAAFIADLTAHLSAENTDKIDVPYLTKAWTARATS